MTQTLQIKRFDFFALQDFSQPLSVAEEVPLAPQIEVSVAQEPPPPPSYTQQELDKARQDALAEGIAQGKQQAQEEFDRRNTDIQQALVQQMRTLGERMAQSEQHMLAHIEQQQEQLLSLAYTIGYKLAMESLHDNAQAVMQALLAQTLPHLLSQPALMIRVHPDSREPVENALGALCAKHHYRGQISVQADDGLHAGDIRMDWQFGSAERSLSTLLQSIDDAFPELDFAGCRAHISLIEREEREEPTQAQEAQEAYETDEAAPHAVSSSQHDHS